MHTYFLPRLSDVGFCFLSLLFSYWGSNSPGPSCCPLALWSPSTAASPQAYPLQSLLCSLIPSYSPISTFSSRATCPVYLAGCQEEILYFFSNSHKNDGGISDFTQDRFGGGVKLSSYFLNSSLHHI